MQQVTIIGNVGRDAQKTSGNGRESLWFSVAVNETWKDAQGVKQERTDWYSVFTTQMNLEAYLVKGTQVFVQGNLNASVYRSEKTNQYGVDLSVRATLIKLLGSKKDDRAVPAAVVPTSGATDNTGMPWDR